MSTKYFILYYLVGAPNLVQVKVVQKASDVQRSLDSMFRNKDVVVIHWFAENKLKGRDLVYAKRMAAEWKSQIDSEEAMLLSKEWCESILADCKAIIDHCIKRAGETGEIHVSTQGSHPPHLVKGARVAHGVLSS